MHHILSYSDSYLYWFLAYICEGIFGLRIYVAVTSPYPRDRGVTRSIYTTSPPPSPLHLRNKHTILLTWIECQHQYLLRSHNLSFSEELLWPIQMWWDKKEWSSADMCGQLPQHTHMKRNISLLLTLNSLNSWSFVVFSFLFLTEAQYSRNYLQHHRLCSHHYQWCCHYYCHYCHRRYISQPSTLTSQLNGVSTPLLTMVPQFII